jgi:hypothetical protein
MAELRCPVCGRHFFPKTGTHKYCTPVCRERAKAVKRTLHEPARYGARHQRARAVAAQLVASGTAKCSRCGKPIAAGAPFDLDHADDGVGYRGVSHPACNRSAPHTRETFEDRPDEGVFWGPPGPDGKPRRWSRAWWDWRPK